MKTLPKDQHKYKLTTSVDRVPLEILKTKLKKTGHAIVSIYKQNYYLHIKL